MDEHEKIKIAISSCLLGEAVRYNGGHKRSNFCTDVLSQVFEFVPYCPEVAIGLGVPRESIRLVGDFDQPRVVGTKTEDLDVTDKLVSYADEVTEQLAGCCGYILMKDSPSCGLYSTKVYHDKGVHIKKRAGVFTARVNERLPLLPMEEAGRLNDAVLRENFIVRVFLYHDWQTTVGREPKAKTLVDFHSRNKYLIMAYSQPLYRDLGRLAASGGKNLKKVLDEYCSKLMLGTKKPANRKGHVNVLFHMVGYLKKTVPGAIRQDLIDAIEEYRYGHVPLAVPMKLMTHYLDHYGTEYIRSQTYLAPHPFQWGLRNSI